MPAHVTELQQFLDLHLHQSTPHIWAVFPLKLGNRSNLGEVLQ